MEQITPSSPSPELITIKFTIQHPKKLKTTPDKQNVPRFGEVRIRSSEAVYYSV